MRDPYTYPNGTLKNKLGIKDSNSLKNAECDLVFLRLISLDEIKFKKIDLNLLKKIHEYIFQDLYEWGGNFRTVPIFKIEDFIIPGLSLSYAEPKDINNKVNAIIADMNSDIWNPNDLNDFSQKLTHYVSKLWKIHPFRDGNTRTTLAFASIFAREHGIDLNLCEKSNSNEHNSSSKNTNTLLNSLKRVIDENTKEVKQYSIRDLFLLASLDETDYPEPKYLNNLFRHSISPIQRVIDSKPIDPKPIDSKPHDDGR